MEPSSLQNHGAPPVREERSTLNAAGYGYMVGDASLFASGMLAGRHKEALSGATYAAGGLVLARYGKEPAERKLERLTAKLHDYFVQEGIAIPQGAALNAQTLAQHGGILHRIEDFLYAHPSEVLNTIYAIGATSMIQSGIQHNKKWDLASGALIAAGALSGLLIKEKAPDTNHRATDPIGKAVEWVQEKPLRLSGGLYMANNVALTMSAINEMRSNPSQKSYLFKFLTAASFIVANSFLTLSSKDPHSEAGEKAHQREALHTLASRAARVIAAQPEGLREAVVQHTSGYLAAQPELGMSAKEIATQLHAELAKVAAPPSRGL